MLKIINRIIATVFVVVLLISTVYYLTKGEVSSEEGYLYSAIGCTSVYKKLNRQDKVEIMLNHIHNFSEREDIQEVQPGHITQFIKLVEKKWEKENDLARRNCDGIYALAEKEEHPAKFNDVAKSVVQYIWDIESTQKKEPLTEEEVRELLKRRNG